MNIIDILLFFLTLFTYGLIFWVSKKLKLSNGITSPGPYWKILLIVIPFFILPMPLLMSIGVYEIFFYSVKDIDISIVYKGSFWVLYAVNVYILSLVFFDKIWKGYSNNFSQNDNPTVITSVIVFSILLLLILVFHFSSTIPILNLGNDSIRVLRKIASDNTPGYVRNSLQVVSVLGSAYAGTLWATSKNRLLSLVLLFFCCIGLGWNGSKSGVVYAFLFFFFSYLMYSGRNLKITTIFSLAAVVLGTVLALYLLSYQGRSLESIVTQIVGRVFMGQMIGFYEALNRFEPNPVYILNWIPFGGAFGINVEPFAKQLMTDIHGETDTLGYMNSLFIQEAWATLGVLGIIISPVIVAFNTIVSMRFIFYFARKIAGPRFAYSSLFVVLNSPSIVGELGAFVFFKGLIFNAFILIVIALIVFLAGKILPIKNNLKLEYER